MTVKHLGLILLVPLSIGHAQATNQPTLIPNKISTSSTSRYKPWYIHRWRSQEWKCTAIITVVFAGILIGRHCYLKQKQAVVTLPLDKPNEDLLTTQNQIKRQKKLLAYHQSWLVTYWKDLAYYKKWQIIHKEKVNQAKNKIEELKKNIAKYENSIMFYQRWTAAYQNKLNQYQNSLNAIKEQAAFHQDLVDDTKKGVKKALYWINYVISEVASRQKCITELEIKLIALSHAKNA